LREYHQLEHRRREGESFIEAEIIGRNFSCFYTAEDVAGQLPQKALATARDAGRFEAQAAVCAKWRSLLADVLIHPSAMDWARYRLREESPATLRSSISSNGEGDYIQSQKQEMIGQLTGASPMISIIC